MNFCGFLFYVKIAKRVSKGHPLSFCIMFICLRRAHQAKAFFGSFAPPKEMNQRTEALKGRARERTEQKEAGKDNLQDLCLRATIKSS